MSKNGTRWGESDQMKKLTRVQRKRRRQRRFLRIILLIAIITLILFFLFKSDFFIINNIELEGNYIIPSEEILRTSGINLGSHIFNYNKTKAEERIDSFPYIKEVDIRRKLPKTVQIIVEEREVYVQFNHLSSYILVDDEGYILEIKEDRLENIPVFRGFTIEDHSRENILEEDELKTLDSFILDSNNKDLMDKINEIIYESERNININLKNGIEVAFGPVNNVKYKLSLLNDILIHIEENEINTKTILMNKGENPIIVTDD